MLTELPHSYLLFLGDLIGEGLGGVQDLDGRLILQDVPLGGRECLQDLVCACVCRVDSYPLSR